MILPRQDQKATHRGLCKTIFKFNIRNQSTKLVEEVQVIFTEMLLSIKVTESWWRRHIITVAYVNGSERNLNEIIRV